MFYHYTRYLIEKTRVFANCNYFGATKNTTRFHLIKPVRKANFIPKDSYVTIFLGQLLMGTF
jgi:hypothetical protein